MKKHHRLDRLTNPASTMSQKNQDKHFISRIGLQLRNHLSYGRFVAFYLALISVTPFPCYAESQEDLVISPSSHTFPTSIQIPGFPNKKVQMWHPDDGTTVVLVEDHRSPLIFISIKLPSGSGGFMAARRRQMNRPTIRKKLQNLSMDVSIDNSIAISFLKEDSHQAMEILREILYDAPPSPKRTKEKKKINTQSFNRPQDILETHVSHTFCSSSQAIKPIDIKKILKELDSIDFPTINLHTKGRLFGFAGDLTFEESKQLLDDLQLPAATQELSESKIKEWDEKLDILAGKFKIMGECQKPSQNQWEFFSPAITQVYFSLARYHKTSNNIKQQIADSILRKRLKQTFTHTGDAYQIYVNDVFSLYQIQSYTRFEKATEFETKLKGELKQFAEQGISAEELSQALTIIQAQLAFKSEHPTYIMYSILNNLAKKRDPLHNYLFLERVNRLTVEEVNSFIRKFFDPNQFVMFKLIPTKKRIAK